MSVLSGFIGLVPMFMAFPEGTEAADFYTGLDEVGLGMFAAMLILAFLANQIFVKKDGNFSQAIGWVLILIIIVGLGGRGLTALQDVLIATWNMAVSFVLTT